MRMNEQCAACMFGKEIRQNTDPEYQKEIQNLLSRYSKTDSSPLMAWRFQKLKEAKYGTAPSYAEIKREYNNLVLSLVPQIREQIAASEDPLLSSISYARIGNYIDFAALDHVNPETLLELLREEIISDNDRNTYRSFCEQCSTAQIFLLITDNCGEVVLDRIMLEEVKKRWPEIRLQVLVRGGEIVNDAVMEDAVYAGITETAEVISSGCAVAGTVPSLLSEEARNALDSADVILAKGQGNYESLSQEGYHVFYSFLCKCDLFADRFQVPKLSGMFIEEDGSERNG